MGPSWLKAPIAGKIQKPDGTQAAPAAATAPATAPTSTAPTSTAPQFDYFGFPASGSADPLGVKIFSYAAEFLPSQMSQQYLNALRSVVGHNAYNISKVMAQYVPQDVAAKTFSEGAGPSNVANYFHYLLQVAAGKLKWAEPNKYFSQQVAQYVYAKMARNKDFPGIPASIASQLPPEPSAATAPATAPTSTAPTSTAPQAPIAGEIQKPDGTQAAPAAATAPASGFPPLVSQPANPAGQSWFGIPAGSSGQASGNAANPERQAALASPDAAQQAAYYLSRQESIQRLFANSWFLDAYERGAQAMQSFATAAPDVAAFDDALGRFGKVLSGTSLPRFVREDGELFTGLLKSVRLAAISKLANPDIPPPGGFSVPSDRNITSLLLANPDIPPPGGFPGGPPLVASDADPDADTGIETAKKGLPAWVLPAAGAAALLLAGFLAYRKFSKPQSQAA